MIINFDNVPELERLFDSCVQKHKQRKFQGFIKGTFQVFQNSILFMLIHCHGKMFEEKELFQVRQYANEIGSND